MMKLSAVRLAFASRRARVDAVAAVATPVPVGVLLITGVVRVGVVRVLLVRVWAAANVTTVSVAPGKVMTVPSVPANVRLLLTVNALPAAKLVAMNESSQCAAVVGVATSAVRIDSVPGART